MYYRKFLLLHQTYYEEESDSQSLGSILYASADITVVGRISNNNAVNIGSLSSLGGVSYLSNSTILSQSSYVAGVLGVGNISLLSRNIIGAASPLLSASALNNSALNNIGNYIILQGVANITPRALSSILGYNRFVNVGYITSDSMITVAGQVQGNGTLTAISFIGCGARLAINSNVHLDNVCYVLDGCSNNFVGNVQFGISDHIKSTTKNEIGALSDTTLKSSLHNNPTVSLIGYDILTGATNALYNSIVNIRASAPLINIGQILSDSFIVIGGQVLGESKLSVHNVLESQSYLNILSSNNLYNIGYVIASLTNPSQFDSIFGPHILYIEQFPEFEPLYIEQQKNYDITIETLLNILG